MAAKTNTHMDNIDNLCIWGNHSPTMVPDLTYCKVNGKMAMTMVDSTCVDTVFTPEV